MMTSIQNTTDAEIKPLDISYAISQDAADPLSRFRSYFHIPTKSDLTRPTLAKDPAATSLEDNSECIYLLGHSLGLQPKRASDYISAFLTQWRTKAHHAHFQPHTDSPVRPFMYTQDHAASLMAPLVGAHESEVAVMGSLTGNLHVLMSSFYQPVKGGRHKILLEGKAFPSDHYAVESQVTMHGFDPKDAMVLLEPTDPQNPLLSTEQICAMIDKHADQLALILLPGVQFYTGQYFDIKTITAHAHNKDIPIGWDCAHAAGNVDLRLHEWNVDFAVWCSYKYLNSGPGAMAGIFVHERHGLVDMTKAEMREKYRPRLTGWWGHDVGTRFQMTNGESNREEKNLRMDKSC